MLENLQMLQKNK